MVLEGDAGDIWAVAFHPDGKHFFDGTSNGIRRWQVADGQELGRQTGMNMYAISVSRDHKWVVCAATMGASVWDAELREKVVEVEGGERVVSVDVAPNCTKFATGGYSQVIIWSITTGEKLLGPLEHGDYARGLMFSPDGGRLATACYGDSTIRIFDAHNGDRLISIKHQIPDVSYLPITWSTHAHSQQLFAVSTDYKIKSFDSSTGSPLAEWQIHGNSNGPMSIALSANGKFIASSAGRFISFWDASTHTQLGVVEETHNIHSVALSPDGCRLATGSRDSGSSIIQDLRGILPDTYLPGNVSTPFLKSMMAFIHDSLSLYTRKSLVQTVSAGSSCVQSSELIPIDV